MKLNPILTIIALAFSGLVFYGFYAMQSTLLLSLFSSISFAIYFVGLFAFSYVDAPRNTVLLKVSSAVLAISSLIVNIIFAFVNAALPLIVIVNSLCVIIWLALLYAFGQKKL